MTKSRESPGFKNLKYKSKKWNEAYQLSKITTDSRRKSAKQKADIVNVM